MENLHGNSRVPRLSPHHMIRRGSFEKEDAIDSPLMRYLRGSSQSPVDAFNRRSRHTLSLVENLMRSPPVRGVLREEVLVMDGVLVATDGKRRSAGSPASSASSDSSSRKTLHKGQILLGKENMRPTRLPGRNKYELIKSTPRSGSCTPSPKSRLFFYQIMGSAEAAASALSPKMSSTSKTVNSAAKSPPSTSKTLYTTSTTPITIICCGDWLPQDDGIEVVLPSSTEKPSSKADVDKYITASLYGPTTRKRLTAFSAICPE